MEANKKTTIILFVLFGLPLFVAGILRMSGASNRDWAIGAIILYLLPIVLMLLRKTPVKAAGVWIGIFLIAEFVYSTFFFDHNYKTLPPNMKQQFEIVGDVMPGFTGIETVSTDEMGFRVTREIEYSNKAKNTWRVFAIGGSTTEQIYLDDHETWTHLLQEQLKELHPDKIVEVINTGLSGLRAEQHLSTLKVISAYQPDQVIFLVGVNDWNRQIRFTLNEELARKEFLKQFDPKRSLIGMAIDGIRAKHKAKKAQLNQTNATAPKKVDGAYYASVNRSFSNRPLKAISFGDVFDEYRQTMDDILDFCQNASFECIFLTQPHGYKQTATQDLIDRFWMTPPKEDYTVGMEAMGRIADAYNLFLLQSAQDKSLKTCDLADAILPNTTFFYDDCHYNEAGARQVASIVAQCLKSK